MLCFCEDPSMLEMSRAQNIFQEKPRATPEPLQEISLVGYSGRGQRDEATKVFEVCIVPPHALASKHGATRFDVCLAEFLSCFSPVPTY